MKKSIVCLSVLSALLAIFLITQFDAAVRGAQERRDAQRPGTLVVILGITDVSLFTEARYTRHPTQADIHTPAQDHPLAMDHFPSGSLVPPIHLVLPIQKDPPP